MKFVWTDAGDDPSWGVGDKHGIDGYFWPMFDSLTTRANLEDTKNRGHVAGIYFGHNWPQGNDSPAKVASRAAEEYKRCYVPGLRVMFNWEQHDPGWIATQLEEWRKLYRTVPTSWSMEGMQGGWMSKAFVERVMATRVRWVPQTFWGGMAPIAQDAVLRDLMRRGVPENVISCFYDAARLEDRWDGYAFTMGRLPG